MRSADSLVDTERLFGNDAGHVRGERKKVIGFNQEVGG